MLRGKAILTAAAFVATVSMSGYVAAQGCSTCDTGQGVYQSAFGGSFGGNSFGYPGSIGCESAVRGCGSCGTSGCSCKQHLKDKWEHTKKIAERVSARNRAWPKPFACADRQVYFSMWEPMVVSGYRGHTTLHSAHFDAETNELNKYGRSTIAAVVNNLPAHHRQLWIHRSNEQDISDTRMAEVKDVIENWYAKQNVQIAFSDSIPLPASGNAIENINRLNRENTPNPIIPVASGTSGTTNIGQGQ